MVLCFVICSINWFSERIWWVEVRFFLRCVASNKTELVEGGASWKKINFSIWKLRLHQFWWQARKFNWDKSFNSQPFHIVCSNFLLFRQRKRTHTKRAHERCIDLWSEWNTWISFLWAFAPWTFPFYHSHSHSHSAFAASQQKWIKRVISVFDSVKDSFLSIFFFHFGERMRKKKKKTEDVGKNDELNLIQT